MLVPKAAMHKDGFAPARKNDVGMTRQTLAMQSVSIAELRQDPPDLQFRLHVFAADSPHILTSANLRDCVRHVSQSYQNRTRIETPRRSNWGSPADSHQRVRIRSKVQVAYAVSRWVREANNCWPTDRATGGGNALPTCRYAAVLPPENSQSSGNP